MGRLLAVACVLTGCGGNLPPISDARPTAIDVIAPPPERASFAVVPAELADNGVLDRIRHRARVRRIGNASLRVDGNKLDSSRTNGELAYVLPVIGESRMKIRVVADDDDARLAVWIDRGDAWDSIAKPIQLADRDGHAAPDAGAWAVLGAPVEIRSESVGERRVVRIRDNDVRVEGWVAATVVAKVWLAPAGDRAPLDLKMNEVKGFAPPADAHAKLALHATIRAAPDPRAAVIATIEQLGSEEPDVRAAVVRTVGAFREIELIRHYVRIRGFVLASEVTVVGEPLIGHGAGSGHGFGMSHTDRIDIPAGTCLFDAIDGEVTGVQLAPSTRMGRRRTDGPWSMVYVENAWSVATLYVRDTSGDPKQPHWESCTEPVHRR